MSSFENKEAISFVVTAVLDADAIKYIKTFKGLMGIPEEFCEHVIKNALRKETADFTLDHDISVKFEVSKEQIVYPEPW